MCRSEWKSFFIYKNIQPIKIKKTKFRGKKKKKITKTKIVNFVWKRNTPIARKMLGQIYKVHCGKVVNTVHVKNSWYLGKKLGEFTETRKEFIHRRTKDRKKREKEKKEEMKRLRKLQAMSRQKLRKERRELVQKAKVKNKKEKKNS